MTIDSGELAVARQQRLRQTMLELNVPAVLILDPVNILYATGASNMPIFLIRTPARYYLLFADGPSLLFDYFGCEHLSSSLTTVDRVLPARGLCHVSSSGDALRQGEQLASEIKALFAEYSVAIDKLAIDRFPFQTVDALRASGFHLVDADPVFAQSRRIKLDGEIELMREAMHRVAGATEVMKENISPGRTETEIWSDFIAPFFATEGRYLTTRLLQSGPRSFPYFQEAGKRQIEANELLCFDTDAVGYQGYCVDFSRTYLCRDTVASAVQRTLYSQARDQLEHNIELIQAGAAYRDIAEAAWPVPAEHQESRYYCIGHGLGMSGEFPNIAHVKADEPYPIEGELEAGMVICVESYIGSSEAAQGVKLEEQLLITDTGIERMSESVAFDERLESREF